jgi:hypothetical protein
VFIVPSPNAAWPGAFPRAQAQQLTEFDGGAELDVMRLNLSDFRDDSPMVEESDFLGFHLVV